MQFQTTDEGELPIWYLPDEFGMRIGHNFESNCRMIPFYYFFDNMAYSLLFPVQDISDRGKLEEYDYSIVTYLTNLFYYLSY